MITHLCEVLRVHVLILIFLSYNNKAHSKVCLSNIGDWSSGMIGVSKTFGGGSIPSSPAK